MFKFIKNIYQFRVPKKMLVQNSEKIKIFDTPGRNHANT